MSLASLAPLLKPCSVTVIGAGQDAHRIRGKILHTPARCMDRLAGRLVVLRSWAA